MWEVSKFRVRAHLDAQKRARDRKESGVNLLNLRRVEAELKVVDNAGHASAAFGVRVLLNDLSPLGVRVFSTQPLVVGQKVCVTWGGFEQFQATGRVIACLEATVSGRILSNSQFPHRIAIEFIFTTKEEQENIRKYCFDVAQIAA